MYSQASYERKKKPFLANSNFLILHFGLVYVKENLKPQAIREIREGRASY